MSVLKKIIEINGENWLNDHEYDPKFKSKLTDAELKEALTELLEEKKKQEDKK